jgi:hypothetical protein
MRVGIKLVLAGLATAIVLSLAVGAASARRFEVSERGFLARWTTDRPLIVNIAGNRISCPVTLEGSFHSRTTSKVCGQLVGYITTAQFAGTEPPCKGGVLDPLAETLPWHIQYSRFAGTLPAITRIRILLVGLQVGGIANGIVCLLASTQASPIGMDINLVGGRADSITLLAEFGIPVRGEFICSLAGNASLEGTAPIVGTLITPQVAITVRLVQ